MKKIIFFLLVTFLFNGLYAQLANTKWKGTLNLDSPMDVVFNFTKDTLEVTSVDDNSSLETNIYSVQDSVLSIQKLYGQSQCDSAAGKYIFSISGNQLTLNVKNDPCDSRAQIIGSMKLNKE